MSRLHSALPFYTLIALLSGACAETRQDGPPHEPGLEETDLTGLGSVTSGTRLRVRRLVTADGAIDALGFADSARGGEPCRFMLDEAGTHRCLPDVPYLDAGASFTVRFADASCTQRLASMKWTSLHSGCDAPRYVLKAIAAGACEPVRYQVLRAAMKRVPPGTTTYEDDGYGCQPRVATTDLIASESESAPEVVPPTEFVAAARVEEEGLGRLRAKVLVGEDGSRIRLGLWDQALGAACSFAPAEGGAAARCVPLGDSMDKVRVGDCKGPSQEAVGAGTCHQDFGYETETTSTPPVACGYGRVYRLTSLGQQTIARGIFNKGTSESSCVSLLQEVYTKGEDVSDRLVTIPHPARSASPRLARRTDGTWFDNELATPCAFQPTQAGIRCVPTERTDLYFADATCQGVPMISHWPKEKATSCETLSSVAVVTNELLCPPPVRTFAPKAETALSTVFSNRTLDGACTAFPVRPRFGANLSVYEATELDATRLADAKIEVD